MLSFHLILIICTRSLPVCGGERRSYGWFERVLNKIAESLLETTPVSNGMNCPVRGHDTIQSPFESIFIYGDIHRWTIHIFWDTMSIVLLSKAHVHNQHLIR